MFLSNGLDSTFRSRLAFARIEHTRRLDGSVLFSSESSTRASLVSHLRCAGYMTASRTKGGPLLPLDMRDSLDQEL